MSVLHFAYGGPKIAHTFDTCVLRRGVNEARPTSNSMRVAFSTRFPNFRRRVAGVCPALRLGGWSKNYVARGPVGGCAECVQHFSTQAGGF